MEESYQWPAARIWKIKQLEGGTQRDITTSIWQCLVFYETGAVCFSPGWSNYQDPDIPYTREHICTKIFMWKSEDTLILLQWQNAARVPQCEGVFMYHGTANISAVEFLKIILSHILASANACRKQWPIFTKAQSATTDWSSSRQDINAGTSDHIKPKWEPSGDSPTHEKLNHGNNDTTTFF